ncbi:MAG: hypothetical protein DRP01_00835 [Archaeoglobales archaeon]|nr:MAG: hypothetical protein DRP01_00835 [Archaeoglobales archaeon]
MRRLEEEDVERIVTVAGDLIGMYLVLAQLSELLGVSLYELFTYVIRFWYLIPWKWIVEFYPFWIGLHFSLLVAMFADMLVNTYYSLRGRYLPSMTYTRLICIYTFFATLLLTVVFRTPRFYVLLFLSFLGILHTFFYPEVYERG